MDSLSFLEVEGPRVYQQNLAMTNGVLCVYDAVPGEDAFAAGGRLQVF